MQGRIYISGSFLDVSAPKSKSDWRDNCPHFWTSPPTWGICRFDLRAVLTVGDYVFFVLPKSSRLPQMIYGYMKIGEIITHHEAYQRSTLASKRMGNKIPNGNIIVDANGNYSSYDLGQHRANFEKIKRHFAIGVDGDSEFLSESKIIRKAPQLQAILNLTFAQSATSPIEVISRKGRRLSDIQVMSLVDWLKN